MARTKRAAFTLVELLVVIAIIGTLVGMLLPAVNQSREAARRTECQTKIKQMAQAALGFHDARNAFPVNYSGRPGVMGSNVLLQGDGFLTSSGAGSKLWGHNTFLLPYLEEQATFDMINFNNAPTHANNFNVRNTVLSVFMCPSDPAVVRPLTPGLYYGFNANSVQHGSVVGENANPPWGSDPGTAGTNGYIGSMCNYPGSAGDTYMGSATYCGATGYATNRCGGSADGPQQGGSNYAGGRELRSKVFRGIFTNQMVNNSGYVTSSTDNSPNVPAQRIALITDGTAKTILFGHQTSGNMTWNGLAWYSGFNAIGTSVPPDMAHICADMKKSHPIEPTSNNCGAATAWKQGGSSSFHGNAWPVAMADGSVRWLSRGISLRVSNALGSKNGENTRNFAGTTNYASEDDTSGAD